MSGMTVECEVAFGRKGSGGRKVAGPPVPVSPGRIPRVSKLMALAIRFDRLVASGVVEDFAELARLGHVTRARVSQIMALVNLAPDLQEELLFLPPISAGRDKIILRQLAPACRASDWKTQRRVLRRALVCSGVQSRA